MSLGVETIVSAVSITIVQPGITRPEVKQKNVTLFNSSCKQTQKEDGPDAAMSEKN